MKDGEEKWKMEKKSGRGRRKARKAEDSEEKWKKFNASDWLDPSERHLFERIATAVKTIYIYYKI